MKRYLSYKGLVFKLINRSSNNRSICSFCPFGNLPDCSSLHVIGRGYSKSFLNICMDAQNCLSLVEKTNGYSYVPTLKYREKK